MPLPAGDCLLEGRLLELWPDGVIARPPRYSEEEWNEVMLPNTKWNHRAECCGHTSLAISVLNNQGLIIEALHALIHHAQHGQLKRGDVVSVFTATRFVYNEMVAYHEITNSIIDYLSSVTGTKPVNLVVLRNLVRKEHERLGIAVETIIGSTVHSRNLVQTLAAAKDCQEICLKSAYVEMEELVYQLRKNFTPGKYQSIVQHALDKMTTAGASPISVNSKVFAVMFGGIGANSRIERMAIMNSSYRWVAWLTWAVLVPSYYLSYLVPLRRVISKGQGDREAEAEAEAEVLGSARPVSASAGIGPAPTIPHAR